MIFIQLSAFILLVMGIVRVLELTPERINKDLSGFFEKRESLQDMSRVARGTKKQNKIVKELSRIRRILTETGKEKNFSVALTLSLILMVSGRAKTSFLPLRRISLIGRGSRTKTTTSRQQFLMIWNVRETRAGNFSMILWQETSE